MYGGTGNLNSSFGIILANVLSYGYKRVYKRFPFTNGQTLVYNSESEKWENKAIETNSIDL